MGDLALPSPCCMMGFPKDSGKRSFHPAENYDGIKESVVTVDVDGEMVQASPLVIGCQVT